MTLSVPPVPACPQAGVLSSCFEVLFCQSLGVASTMFGVRVWPQHTCVRHCTPTCAFCMEQDLVCLMLCYTTQAEGTPHTPSLCCACPYFLLCAVACAGWGVCVFISVFGF